MDEGIPFVFSVVRETVQEFLGFSPFELVSVHTVHGLVKMLHEALGS